MEKVQNDAETLDTRCPDCRQRFSVTADFMNRLVECGGCDHQFRISEDVIIRSRKFYPGERKGPDLKHFQRVPPSAGIATGRSQPAGQMNFKKPRQYLPASPQHIIAGIFGVVIMIATALIMLFSGSPGSAFSSMTIENKLIIGGFVSVLGVALLVYANPHARIKAALVGLVFAAGVLSIPFLVGKIAVAPADYLQPPADESSTEDTSGKDEPEVNEVAVLRERFFTKPLEEQQQRLAESGSGGRAVGIYLTNLAGGNKYTVRDYLIRATGADITSSYLYPQRDENYLMVLAGIEKQNDVLLAIAAKLGEIQAVYPEISIIAVRVDNEQFLSPFAEKLNDRSDPAFYALNRNEMRSIDLDRVESAVNRLADSEAQILREDISRLLIDLLNQPGIKFHSAISRALLKWADDPGPAADAGLNAIKEYVAKNQAVPEELVALVAKGRQEEAIPIVIELWAMQPVLWARYVSRFGQAAEPFLLEKLESDRAPLRQSALKLLGKVGSEKSIPTLKEILSEDDPEIRLLAERAIQEIGRR